MSIFCWNCQGAGSSETVLQLREFRRKYFPDFLFLMETKQKLGYMKGLQQSLGYDHLVTVEPVGLSGGLAVFWKDSYSVSVLSSDKRIIDMKVGLGSVGFFLTCVYGDPVKAKRQEVWERLIDIGLVRDEAWILAGDFNELMSNEEKSGGAIRSDASFWDFRNMAENCKIKELRYTGNCLSWIGVRDRAWVQCRLDRSFGNSEWFSLFPRSNMEYLEMWASDHRPIRILFVLEKEDPSRSTFFFDNRCINKPGFEEVVKQSWGSTELDTSNTMDRIGRCRKNFRKWKKNSDSNSRTKITRLHAELEKEIAKRNPSFYFMKKLRVELAEAIREEEQYWRQKCREEWLRSGDRNTKYFHNCVKGKRLKNRILMLLDELGQEHFTEGSKGNIAVEYYRELFRSSNPHDLDSVFCGFRGRVSEEMNSRLTAPISPEEIKKAAFSIKGASAPGEDGLTGIFYQKFWHIVGPQLTAEITQFFKTSVMPEGWNHTQLSLLPKITKPTKMQDLRPISLCSVQYKIISKVLCNRLKVILPQIISETQGAFVAGRLISDNILIAHEMVHGLRTNPKVSEECMAIKTDMSKAYDRVEWNFLEALMERMGFDRVWIRWIMSCVNTVSFSVLLNGTSHGFIRPERGIRQGDPLSPFLFILCAEGLVSCLNTAEEENRITGIKLSTSCPSVHHLLFADDSLLLCKASTNEADEIMNCLKLYGQASGQLINLQKSSVIFGSKVPDSVKMEIKEVLGIDQEGGEGYYLGLPECFSGSKVKLLSFIKEKLQGRLQGWFAKSLSQGGKEILLKSVALALPIYAMSCFKLPKDVCAKITSIMIEFWWSSGSNKKKISWVAWQKLCKDKELGGMGFREIEKFNQSLLAKQAWRIWSNPTSLVARILKQRYFARSTFLDCGVGTRPSYAWRSILHGRELLSQGLLQKIGDGTNTRVWTDNWIMDVTPRPPRYQQDGVVDLTLTVNDLLDPLSGSWNVQRVRELIYEDDVELVLQTNFKLSSQDVRCWGFSKNGVYNSKSGYKLAETLQLNQNGSASSLPPIEKRLWRDLWKTKTTPKIKHFMWRALSGALAVKQGLRSRGIVLDTTCPQCGTAAETICHVLFHCETAKEVWALSQIPLPPGGFALNSVWLNFYHLLSVCKKSPLDSAAVLSFPWILWQLWKARNTLIFEQTQLSSSVILAKASEEAAMWMNIQLLPPEGSLVAPLPVAQSPHWVKPPRGTYKCNIASSWISPTHISGAALLVRDSSGLPLCHSRRSFGHTSSALEAELQTIEWAVDALCDIHVKRVILEISSPAAMEALFLPDLYPLFSQGISKILRKIHSFDLSLLSNVPKETNSLALQVAVSVTRDRRLQSYMARGGPNWLSDSTRAEAMNGGLATFTTPSL